MLLRLPGNKEILTVIYPTQLNPYTTFVPRLMAYCMSLFCRPLRLRPGGGGVFLAHQVKKLGLWW